MLIKIVLFYNAAFFRFPNPQNGPETFFTGRSFKLLRFLKQEPSTVYK